MTPDALTLRCARLSALAYTSADLRLSGDVAWQLDTSATPWVLYLRGSTDLEDFKDDAEIVERPVTGYKIGSVNEGFQEGLAGIVQVLLSMDPPLQLSTALATTGHSLAAARAYVLAGMLKFLGYNLVRTIGFAPPNVGNWEFTSYMAGAVPGEAWARSGDIIPFMPTTSTLTYPHQRIGTARASLNPFFNHHMSLYLADIEALAGAAP